MATELQVQRVSAPAAISQLAPCRRAALFSPRLLPAVLSGALLWACYFPLGWGWLAWVALVPLLCLVRAQGRALGIYFAAWAGGLAFFVPALYWMSVADYRMVYAWIALAMYCALYTVAAIWLLRRLDQGTRLPLLVTVPGVWTGLEFLRSYLLTGFAWYFLGHSQHDYLGVIQIADITGAYGVSFLVAAVNAWLFLCLYRAAWFRGLFRLSDAKLAEADTGRGIQLAAVLGMVILTLAYGLWRLEQHEFKPGPRIVLLQGNLDQRLRNRAATDRGAQQSLRDHYDLLRMMALKHDPHLVIWPETSYWGVWHDVIGMPPPVELQLLQDELLEPVRKHKVHQLLGMNANIIDRTKQLTRYNTALLVTAGGDFNQRYDKIHRVPFGEYVPLREILPFLNNFAPYDYDYSISVGTQYTRFAFDKYRFGVLICFEDTDPVLARRYHREGADGPGVDFLVNMSNDGWFDGSSEHEEHLAISRFRAIECRRAVVRSVNMGISAVIDGNGRVQRPQLVSGDSPVKSWVIQDPDGDLPTARWGEFKKVSGILVAMVPIDRRTSFYARWGDWLPWLCWCVIVGGLAWGWWRRRHPRPAPAAATVVGPMRLAAPGGA